MSGRFVRSSKYRKRLPLYIPGFLYSCVTLRARLRKADQEGVNMRLEGLLGYAVLNGFEGTMLR